jgi:hypothetical protein
MRRKENGLSSSTVKPTTPQSGISRIDNLPKILKYPRLLPFFTSNAISPGDSVKGMLCYIMRHYGSVGLTVLIYRDKKSSQMVVICGDWEGQSIDLTDDSEMSRLAKTLLSKNLERMMGMMRHAKIDQAQIYFAIQNEEFILVDIQTALNKFAGPGMVRDLFSNIFKTPEIIKIEPLDDRSIIAIRDGAGSYSGELVIKPSKFRLFEDGINEYRPLYLEVKR